MTPKITALFKQIRAYQWSKNALIFVPIIAAHRVMDWEALKASLMAFCAFSLCASAGYVWNDLRDLAADRKHPEKKSRPLASGTVTSVEAWLLIGALLLGTILFSLGLPLLFQALLLVYLVVAYLYSQTIKRMPIADVVVLAIFYSLRVFGGGLATGIAVSQWLITFSMFFFLNLAFIKRFSEITLFTQEKAELKTQGRGYVTADLTMLLTLGAISGFMSVLVFTLYLQSPDVARLYAHPGRLWLACPVQIYWIGRLWLLTDRGQVEGDPVLFVIKDPVSHAVLALLGCIFVLGSI